MMVAEHMQGPVDSKPDQLFREADSIPREARRGFGADVHVTHEPTVGLWQGIRDDVGEAAPTCGAPIQAPHVGRGQQGDVHVRMRGRALPF